MQRLVILVIGIWAMGATFFQVNWYDQSKAGVTVRAPGLESEVNECLDGHHEAKIRFEIRMCRRREGWLDACSDELVLYRSVTYDPITESFRVVSDRIGDRIDPVAIGMPSRVDAVKATVLAENIALHGFFVDEPQLLGHPATYIQTRAVFVCKGSVNRTFGRLSQILTLGLVNIIESDSGWEDFSMGTARDGSSTVAGSR